MALIAVTGLTKDYVTHDITTRVLSGVSFTIDRGEFVSIMGPSGSGKSTLMHILGFLDTPTRGTYVFDGQETSAFTDTALAGIRSARVGFVFQAFHLLPRTSVKENVALPLLYSKKIEDRDAQITRAIEAVGLSHRADHLSNQLSGGEKQRVAIARALVNNPDVIFADEPTGNLDSKSGNQILRILQTLNDAGHTIIMVTHEQDTADHSRRILRIRDGLLESDTPVSARRFASEGDLKK